MVARVEGGLSAADLAPWDIDLEVGGAEKGLRVGDGLREHEVAKAGREELYARAHSGERTK
jgi:hypothetical protein